MKRHQKLVPLTHKHRLRGLTQTREGVVVASLPEARGPLCDVQQLASGAKLVVRRAAGLGDCLMLLPALMALKRERPDIHLVLQVPREYQKLMVGFNIADEVWKLEDMPPAGAVWELVDVSHFVERHPAAWEIDRVTLFAEAFGIEPVPSAAAYRPPAKDLAWAREWLEFEETPRGPRVGLCLEGKYRHRSWMVKYVFELAKRLTRRGHRCIIFADDRSAQRSAMTGRPAGIRGRVRHAYGFELPQVAALLHMCDVAVAPDTGLLHLGASVGTACVGIFGAVPPHLRTRFYESCECLWAKGKVACVPCCEGPQHQRCNLECLKAITPAMVEAAIERALAGSKACETTADEGNGVWQRFRNGCSSCA